MTTLEQVTNSKKNQKFLNVHNKKKYSRKWVLDFASRKFYQWLQTGIDKSLALVRVDEELKDFLPS